MSELSISLTLFTVNVKQENRYHQSPDDGEKTFHILAEHATEVSDWIDRYYHARPFYNYVIINIVKNSLDAIIHSSSMMNIFSQDYLNHQ